MNEDKMGGALEHWLGFQDKIGRSFMMNEDAIKYPLSDYLVNDGGIHIDAIELQRFHPNFTNRLVDVAIIDRTVDYNPKPLINVFELKVAKSDTGYQSEKQRIFSDLVRLHLAKQHSSGNSYFIIIGKSIYFTRNFRDCPIRNPALSKIDSDRFYQNWFSFVKGDKMTFQVASETDNSFANIYDSILI